ncbi:hypothetical protein C8A05DRAFT_35030 [Staphylotrichum tortipilum]|uniref:Uncharacterized protein n=1 Tax=Staphylotrichum tortipilum TaxID=2831512 RepID=A0AAN6RSE8_9PEZI|nr:hypothetical protein C8A05DRAFT_35030 [Staphylotrichum longicolle]
MARNEPFMRSNGALGPIDDRLSGDFDGDTPPGTAPYSPTGSVAGSSLSLVRAEKTANTDDQDFIINKKELQLAVETAWFKDFMNRSPDAPFRKSFRRASMQDRIVEGAPEIRIGITFMGGADKPTVVDAELKRLENIKKLERTPEWKVYTGGTLLKKIHVGGNLEYRMKDDSAAIIETYMVRTGRATPRQEPRNQSPSRQSSKLIKTNIIPGEPISRALIQTSRDDGDMTLTIDSTQVDLLHALPSDPTKYDLSCTLIEVDMFSMRGLMENYREIAQSGGRRLSTQECLQILDTMINDVRRLCTRSPRLFRMATRALIAQSNDIRYGVDFDSQWITITTSEGIRHLINQSAKYYLSLNDDPEEKATVRPKFLQMIVLLLSLINNRDLKSIKTTLESSFDLPGERPDVELLIMKVLPLGAANPTVFLRGLEDAYSPKTRASSYEYALLHEIWTGFQLTVAKKGYLVPHPTSTTGRHDLGQQTRINLQDLSLDDSDSDSDSESPTAGPRRELTWMLGWGTAGIESSTVLKDLQHDTLLREEAGDGNKSSIRAVNVVPHLDITADEKDQNLQVEAVFTNQTAYRLDATMPDDISTMRKGDYALVRVTDKVGCTLEIREEVLNDHYISATKRMSFLISKAQSLFPERGKSRNPFGGRDGPSTTGLPQLSVPSTAQTVWATIYPSDGSTPQRVATAFKIDNKMVFQYDVVGEMTRIRGKLNATIERVEAELRKFAGPRARTETERRQIQEAFNNFLHTLQEIKSELVHAEGKLRALNNFQHAEEAADPIVKVIYPSIAPPVESQPSWAPYQTDLFAEDNKSLLASCARLTVTSVQPSPAEQTVRLGFKDCAFALHVKPLSPAGRQGLPELPESGSTVMWMGYFIVLVREVPNVAKGFEVVAFYRVQSQKACPGGGKYSSAEDLRRRVARLV